MRKKEVANFSDLKVFKYFSDFYNLHLSDETLAFNCLNAKISLQNTHIISQSFLASFSTKPKNSFYHSHSILANRHYL